MPRPTIKLTLHSQGLTRATSIEVADRSVMKSKRPMYDFSMKRTATTDPLEGVVALGLGQAMYGDIPKPDRLMALGTDALGFTEWASELLGSFEFGRAIGAEWVEKHSRRLEREWSQGGRWWLTPKVKESSTYLIARLGISAASRASGLKTVDLLMPIYGTNATKIDVPTLLQTEALIVEGMSARAARAETGLGEHASETLWRIVTRNGFGVSNQRKQVAAATRYNKNTPNEGAN